MGFLQLYITYVELAAGTQEAPNKLLDRYGLKLLIERHKAFSVRPGYDVKKNIFCKFINFNNLNFIIGIMHLNLVVFQSSFKLEENNIL